MLEKSWIISLPCKKLISIDVDVDEGDKDSKILNEIDELVKKGYDCGNYETEDGEGCNWMVVDSETDLVAMYLYKKEEILKEKGEVFFEHNQKIYEVFKRFDGNFEYNIYNLSDFVSGDVLETIDGGVVEGDEKEAIYAAID